MGNLVANSRKIIAVNRAYPTPQCVLAGIADRVNMMDIIPKEAKVRLIVPLKCNSPYFNIVICERPLVKKICTVGVKNLRTVNRTGRPVKGNRRGAIPIRFICGIGTWSAPNQKNPGSEVVRAPHEADDRTR